jgi:hypothetical protein
VTKVVLKLEGIWILWNEGRKLHGVSSNSQKSLGFEVESVNENNVSFYWQL